VSRFNGQLHDMILQNQMKKKVIFLFLFIVLVTGIIYLLAQVENKQVTANSILSGVEAVIYKSPSCGCCVGFNAEIQRIGVKTEMIATEDMQAVKDRYNIPRNMESCHTMVIGNYFIEGHIPFEVIEKLLTEKPDIDGIALPNMPAGTPGMPGIKSGAYDIYQLKDGVSSIYMSI